MEEPCKCKIPRFLDDFAREDLSKYLIEEEIEIAKDDDSNNNNLKLEKSKSVPQPQQPRDDTGLKSIAPKKEEEYWECDHCPFKYNGIDYNDLNSAKCFNCEQTNFKLQKLI